MHTCQAAKLKVIRRPNNHHLFELFACSLSRSDEGEAVLVPAHITNATKALGFSRFVTGLLALMDGACCRPPADRKFCREEHLDLGGEPPWTTMHRWYGETLGAGGAAGPAKGMKHGTSPHHRDFRMGNRQSVQNTHGIRDDRAWKEENVVVDYGAHARRDPHRPRRRTTTEQSRE